MRKDNYAYFVNNTGEPLEVAFKLLETCGKLPNFKNVQKGIVQKLRKGNQYHFVFPIEDEFKASRGETAKDIELTIYSLHLMVKKLNIKSISVIYYELLKPNETITGERHLTKLMRLSRALRKKRSQYELGHEKVILQYDNARPYVAKLPGNAKMGSSTPPDIFPRYCAGYRIVL